MTEQEFLRFLDQKLIEIGKGMMEYYNPCGQRDGACKGGDPNPCCSGRTIFGDGCPHWQGGCTFHNPDCLLWLCRSALKDADPTCVQALSLLEHLGKLYGLVRAPLIGQNYSGADRQPK